jgi:hypothetical protein
VALLVTTLAVCSPASAQGPLPPPAYGADAANSRDADAGGDRDELSYSELLAAIERREVGEAVLDPQRAEVSVRLDDGREAELGYPSAQDLADRLARAGAKVEVASGGSGGGFPVLGIVPVAAFALSLLFVALSMRGRRIQGPGQRAGGPLRTDTKVSEETRPTVTFRGRRRL